MKTNTILKIAAICVIWTTMTTSGCLETDFPLNTSRSHEETDYYTSDEFSKSAGLMTMNETKSHIGGMMNNSISPYSVVTRWTDEGLKIGVDPYEQPYSVPCVTYGGSGGIVYDTPAEPPANIDSKPITPISVLFDDIVENNIGDRYNLTSMGGSKDYHWFSQVACERCVYITENYEYVTGVLITTYNNYTIADFDVFVTIADTTYIIESGQDACFAEGDYYDLHPTERFEKHSYQKAREYAKCMSESNRRDDMSIIESLKATDWDGLDITSRSE